ncbi:BRCT domain [Trypanosoma melophagium]|uniref:BRCT domain n=1 Tax=Trypanosoma melophagium TaxID=715481 RepID=UPI00351A769C|nr:BRCT domain [Trypanosoma melophagium]
MDPLDATVTIKGWFCPICSVEVSKENTYCQVCLYARPMDRQGVPQIFAGYKMHFNGVIPRTLRHPSHSVEWRMAERHGAVCLVQFDLMQVNLLVYRTGYERSDKVRKCVEGDTNIPAVPITWMLDCLLQSRQIHTALYRLNSIPAVAQPAGKGTFLPHHQHPYYLMNVEEYAIPTSFPPEKKRKGAASDKGALAVGADANLPPFFELQELQYTNIDLFKAVCNTLESKHLGDDDNDQFGDERETRERRANIELLKCEQRHNRVDKLLFSGMKFFLTPSLESDPQLTKALESCGGKIVNSSDGSLTKLLRTAVTHVLYDHGAKKGDVMIEAAQVKKEVPGLTLAQINWAEDCLMLGEVIPPYGQYVPTQKLMETLSKKYQRL